jgi:ABC-type amino acid transport substrate-binding protein
MKNLYIKLIVLSAILVTIGIGTFYRPTVKQDNVLVVGMMSGWAPFMSINEQGNYEGFDVDVAQELAKRMNKQLVIKDMGALAPCFIALEQDSIDLLMSGLDITQERQKKLNMINYTGHDVKQFYLAFWGTIPTGITTINDLKNYPNAIVCVEPGVSTQKLLDKYSFITQKPLSSLADMILDIQYGKSLAAFLEPQVVARLQQKNPQIKTITVPLPAEFQIYGMGIAVSKKHATLAQETASIIKAMRQDGTLARLEKTWQIGVA